MDENEETEKFSNYKNCIADSGDWRTALCDERRGGKAESRAGGREHETARNLHSQGNNDLLCDRRRISAYPLKKNYGIQIDESRFTVFYEVFAKNLMPEITVMENQERVD